MLDGDGPFVKSFTKSPIELGTPVREAVGIVSDACDINGEDSVRPQFSQPIHYARTYSDGIDGDLVRLDLVGELVDAARDRHGVGSMDDLHMLEDRTDSDADDRIVVSEPGDID